MSLREITKHALKKPIIYWRKVYFLMIFPKQQNSGWDICPVSMRKNVILNGKNWRRKYIAKWKNCTRDLLEDTIHGYNGVHILSDHIRPIREQWEVHAASGVDCDL